ncbi:MAG: inovirus-type Gp2 protein [Inhella sp.]
MSSEININYSAESSETNSPKDENNSTSDAPGGCLAKNEPFLLGEQPTIKDLSEVTLQESMLRHHGDATGIFITVEVDEIRKLAQIDRFVSYIQSDTEALAYSARKDRFGKNIGKLTRLGQMCQLLVRGPRFVRADGIRYSENIELFLRISSNYGFPWIFNSVEQLVQPWMSTDCDLAKYSGLAVGEVLNMFAKALQKELKSHSFNQRKADRLAQSERNFRSIKLYTDALFASHKRLLIIRVDLHFQESALAYLTYDDASQYLQRFLNNFRHTRFGCKKVGYIWKLEDGHACGPHVHLLLFLNGAEHQQHAFIAEEIGKYWRGQVAAGVGRYFSCHRSSQSYAFPALGAIDRDDLQKRKNLERVLRYLTKSDQFMKIANYRSLGRGRMPNLTIPKRGRPVKEKLPQTELVADV